MSPEDISENLGEFHQHKNLKLKTMMNPNREQRVYRRVGMIYAHRMLFVSCRIEMVCTYDIFYDRWRSCTISYTFGTLPDRIGAYRYISAITSCDRLLLLLLPINCLLRRVEDHI